MLKHRHIKFVCVYISLKDESEVKSDNNVNHYSYAQNYI